MGFFEKINAGLSRSRERLKEQMNILLDRGPDVDEEFWETLEETLILADLGASAADEIVEELRDQARRKAAPDAYAVFDMLTEQIAATFTPAEVDYFEENPQLILFVGVNGSGKTTTVGKVAAAAHDQGRKVLLGSADTFRAAAVEQISIWGERVGVPVVKQKMGADPASVAFDTLSSAKANDADVVIIDTAGRLHNKVGLMNELTKIKKVMDKVVPGAPQEVLLVLDGSTGQNAFEQARQFTAATEVTALAITKLDGTAKGGVVIGISDQFKTPVKYIGLGEGIEDLQPFRRREFVDSLFGDN